MLKLLNSFGCNFPVVSKCEAQPFSSRVKTRPEEGALYSRCSVSTFESQEIKKVKKQRSTRSLAYHIWKLDRWEAMEGKSGRFFYKTTDDQFVLKQMSRFGYLAFLECGMSMEFLSIENFFSKISRSYDLKGSVRNRLILEDGGQQGAVLLDENLLRVSCERPLYVNEADKNCLNQAIKRDATFLASHRMMDYSLLVGICDENSVLVVGIINYIRTFTWDKKLET